MKRNYIIMLLLITMFNIYSKENTPIYGTVFNQSELLTINIKIDKDDWEAMNQDLVDNFPENGNNRGGGAPAMGTRPTGPRPTGPRPMGNDSMADRPMREIPGDAPINNNIGVNGVNLVDFDPIWVESSITFENQTWEHVGIRFKGNSSLKDAFYSGDLKKSFKLDFDKLDEDYPEVEDRTFYGFEQLNLNNNFNDKSLMREKVASDLFREWGLVSAQTSFCQIYIDFGEGVKSLGIYTIVEEMDDTVIDTQLGDDSGNLYKPEGSGATFAGGTFNENDMEKKSNKKEADYSDVKSLYEMINSSLRITNVTKWKSKLEDVFNVDGFLKWLAANSSIQNWDTYGKMSHNFYLYNDPETGLLNWIPWDNNEALQQGKQGLTTLSLNEVSEDWPLINYILDNKEYKAIYNKYLDQFTSEVFTTNKMTAIYNKYYDLLKEYSSKYDVESLKTHVVNRNKAVDLYLEK
ncbi:MAG: CotH kinase family protein [Spirochaetaceae bacterium]